MIIPSGLKPELRHQDDYVFELIYPDVQAGPVADFPIGRKGKAKLMPVFFQGNRPTCVIEAVLWIASWLGEDVDPQGDVDRIAAYVGLNSKGTYPSDVLEACRKYGFIKNYSYLKDPNYSLLQALSLGPVMIGLWDWPLVPNQGHVMVLIDKLENGDWLCVNWANRGHTDFVTLPPDAEFVLGVSFAPLPDMVCSPNLSLIQSFIWNAKTFIKSICR